MSEKYMLLSQVPPTLRSPAGTFHWPALTPQEDKRQNHLLIEFIQTSPPQQRQGREGKEGTLERQTEISCLARLEIQARERPIDSADFWQDGWG